MTFFELETTKMCLLYQETASIYVQERQKRTLTWSGAFIFYLSVWLTNRRGWEKKESLAKITYIRKTNITHFLRFHETFGLQEILITTYITYPETYILHTQGQILFWNYFWFFLSVSNHIFLCHFFDGSKNFVKLYNRETNVKDTSRKILA